MSIPGLDLCPTGEDDSEPAFELYSFNGTFKIPKSQMNGACRNVMEFKKISILKSTSSWIIRECFDPRKKEEVCIVKYKDSKETNDDIENNLVVIRREIEILSKLNHDNIIQFYEPAVGDTLESVHLVFEFSRYFLSDLIDRNMTGLYQKEMIKNIMCQLFLAIDYLHRNLIMHRDICPTNILLNKDGFLKLANFHNAREHNSKDVKLDVMCKNYQAPEILLKAKQHGPAVDIWATGCLFIELIIKRKFITGDSVEAIFQNIVNVLGSPNNSLWHGYDSLPGLQDIRIESSHSYNLLKKIMRPSKQSTIQSTNLIQDMLIYDPAFRITASACLSHPYFKEDPVAYSQEEVAKRLQLLSLIKASG